MRPPAEILDALHALPCGARLRDALGGRQGVWLVGGAVRDLLLDRSPRELDLVVEGDVAPVAAALGAPVAEHERFGTVTVEKGGCRFDLARARSESYARPGALPDVRPATVAEDLRRRDFTVNAIAVSLDGSLLAVPGALDDLAAGRLRVLHPGSFADDPTRLWRLARYAARLGFTIEDATRRWARQAVADGALETVSGDRLGNELRLALREPDPGAALEVAAQLGLAPDLRPQRAVLERALELLPDDGRGDLAVLAAVVEDDPAAVRAWLDRLGFTAAEREPVVAAARLGALPAVARPSQLHQRLLGVPVEAVAAAGARGDADTARAWLERWRHVRLEITGDDLLAAGVPQGPQIGARLRRVLAARLDGELAPGRDAELAAALGDAPGE